MAAKRQRKSAKPKAKRGKAVSKTHIKRPKKTAPRVELPPPAAPQVGKFDPKYIKIASKMAEFGAIDREMADAFSVDTVTFHRWKIAHPEFAKALKLGKEVPDERVKRSLYNRAVGYSYDSEQLFVDKFGDEHRMPTVTHVPPDTVACIFFLKNRDPDNWRDRQEHFHELVTTPEMLRLARARAGLTQVVAEQGERVAA